jgi:chemotaxis signal transduction protein
MMRLPAPIKAHPVRTEQIILFRVSGHLFAVSSASVQEVRSVDTLAGSAKEISQPSLRKVRHVVQRGEHTLYVVNGAMHFGLPPMAPALVFILRRTRTALLVDGIEKMTTMTRLQALPQAFCNEERDWYRGVTAIDQTVVPVVKPEGFLTPDELFLLDTSLQPAEVPTEFASPETDSAESLLDAPSFAPSEDSSDSPEPISNDSPDVIASPAQPEPDSFDASAASEITASLLRTEPVAPSANANDLSQPTGQDSVCGTVQSTALPSSSFTSAITHGSRNTDFRSKVVLFAQLDSDDSVSYPQ